MQGQDTFRDELAATLRLGLEDVAFVDAARLAELLAPIGPLPVDLPIDVTDASGDVVAAAGAAEMDAAAAAAVLTARDPKVAAAEQYPAAGAVWSAVAQAVGAGIPPPRPTRRPRRPRPRTPPRHGLDRGDAAADAAVATLFDHLIHGRVGTRALRADPIPPTRTSATSTPCSSIRPRPCWCSARSRRARCRHPDRGCRSASSARSATTSWPTPASPTPRSPTATIATILAIGGNVVSVATDGATPGAATTLAVSDATMTDGAKAVQSSLGTVEVTVDEQPIAGVDVVAVIGTDALPTLGTAPGPGTTTTAATTETTDG